jgi:glutathionylspermidine synthase
VFSLKVFTFKEKQNILNQYNKAIYDLNDFFQNTEIESRELENWQTILELVFNPAYNIIYSNNDKILLIWGCDFFNKQENYLKIIVLYPILTMIVKNVLFLKMV